MENLLYNQLADQLTSHISTGVYKIGERLPSVRALAKREQVSIATVNSAYAQLEDRGWVEARPKSGYFVRRASQDPIEPPNAYPLKPRPRPVSTTELAMEVQRGSALTQGASFCTAVPDLSFPINGILQRTFTRLSRSGSPFGQGYDSPEGLFALRQQIARRAIDAGIHLSPDALITTMGAQNSIALALRALTVPGDTVAVESPCYFGLLQMIESFGLKAIEIPCDPQTGLSVEALKLALQQWPIKTILSISNFSNPLGCSIPDANKKAIIGLLQQYDICLIEDDIYGELHFGERRPKTFKAFDEDGRVLWCSSVSKTMDPQLRVGWIAPGRHYQKVLQQKYVNSIASPTLPQSVTADVMEQGQFDRHLRQARLAYQQRCAHLLVLARDYFPAETRASSPQGGLVVWFEMPKHIDATALYLQCREADVRLAPGELFSVSGLYQHCFRLNFAKPWTAAREEAIALIGRQLKTMS
jgi:DNA-binding transcriptional MocR family regulator